MGFGWIDDSNDKSYGPDGVYEHADDDDDDDGKDEYEPYPF